MARSATTSGGSPNVRVIAANAKKYAGMTRRVNGRSAMVEVVALSFPHVTIVPPPLSRCNGHRLNLL
jgi:hypothetical protein